MKRTFVLSHPQARRRALECVREAPDGYSVVVSAPLRNTQQNAQMWALLNELSEQVIWHGQHLSPENWKDICTASLKRQQVVIGIDGGFVVLGTSTRRMTKGEMSELIDFVLAFGAKHGVKFREPQMEVAT